MGSGSCFLESWIFREHFGDTDSCQSPRTHSLHQNTGVLECPNHTPAPTPTSQLKALKLFPINSQFCMRYHHKSHSPAFGRGYNQPNTIPDDQSRVSRVKENGVLTGSATSVEFLNLFNSQFLHLRKLSHCLPLAH